MSLYKDDAIVLRSMRLGEADRIVVFFGRANGKIRAVAKGVRKTKSRFGGRLEPFGHVALVMWRGRSELHTVTQADVIEPFRAVREDLDRFALGQVMLEAVDRVIQEKERSPRLFTLLVDSLAGLTRSSSSLVLSAFLLRLSSVAGFAPTLSACVECGGRASWFSASQGGAVCSVCRSPDADEVGGGMLELMSDLVTEGPWMEVDPKARDEVGRLSRVYAEYHLELRLRSAQLI